MPKSRVIQPPAMSEEECALFGGYEYCQTNAMTPNQIEAQAKAVRHILGRLGNDTGLPIHCGCPRENRYRCTTKSCTNRGTRVACPDTCGVKCKNNWWLRGAWFLGIKTFMVETTQAERDRGAKNHKVIARVKIPKSYMLGEFKGRVRSLNDEIPHDHLLYSIGIPACSQIIDASTLGSIASRVNFVHKGANCEVLEYIVRDKIVIFLKATKDINVGAELTINYRHKVVEVRARQDGPYSELQPGIVPCVREGESPSRARTPDFEDRNERRQRYIAALRDRESSSSSPERPSTRPKRAVTPEFGVMDLKKQITSPSMAKKRTGKDLPIKPRAYSPIDLSRLPVARPRERDTSLPVLSPGIAANKAVTPREGDTSIPILYPAIAATPDFGIRDPTVPTVPPVVAQKPDVGRSLRQRQADAPRLSEPPDLSPIPAATHHCGEREGDMPRPTLASGPNRAATPNVGQVQAPTQRQSRVIGPNRAATPNFQGQAQLFTDRFPLRIGLNLATTPAARGERPRPRIPNLAWPLPQSRPANYREMHNFNIGDPVCFISSNFGRLSGNIIGQFTNAQDVIIFTVSVDGRQYHMPRWMIFSYYSDLDYAIAHNFYSVEKCELRNYLNSNYSLDAAHRLGPNFLSGYQERVMGTTTPTVPVRNPTPGARAIGMSPNFLVPEGAPVKRKQFLTHRNSDGDPEDVVPAHGPSIIIPPQGRNVITPSDEQEQPSSDEDEQEQPSSDEDDQEQPSSDEDDQERPIPYEDDQDVVVPVVDDYDNKKRRDFDWVLDKVGGKLVWIRIIRTVTEQVAFFAYARLPEDSGLTYRAVYDEVYKHVKKSYTNETVEDRCFLRFAHYRLDCENRNKGSWNLKWCSLCRNGHTFKDTTAMWWHFQLCHAICANTYVCTEDDCDFESSFPSKYNKHMADKHPNIQNVIDVTLPDYIRDAFADFVAAKGKSNMPKYFLRPGLPNFTKKEEGKASNRKSAMNLNTNRPVDPSVNVRPLRFDIQKKYTELVAWDQLQFKVEPGTEPTVFTDRKPVGRPRGKAVRAATSGTGKRRGRPPINRPNTGDQDQPRPNTGDQQQSRPNTGDQQQPGPSGITPQHPVPSGIAPQHPGPASRFTRNRQPPKIPRGHGGSGRGGTTSARGSFKGRGKRQDKGSSTSVMDLDLEYSSPGASDEDNRC